MPDVITGSPLVLEYVEGLGSRRGKLKRRHAIHAVVIHTAGAGPVTRETAASWAWWRAKLGIKQDGDAFDAARALYTQVMDASGHYLVGQAGQALQLVDEDLAAWHVGSKGAQVYRGITGSWVKNRRECDWWLERWQGYRSPMELAGGQLWDGGSCNANTIGIEVVPPTDDPRAAWSPECWETLVRLVLDICTRHAIPIHRPYIISHSDAHPIARSTLSGGPWDPGKRQWSYERFAHIARTMPGATEETIDA